jgi:hypothetical protein
MVAIQPLDLEYIFVNTVAGSWTIFFFLAMAFFAYLAARFRMPNQIFLIMMAVFVIFMANYYSLLYAFTILLISLFVFYAISKIPKT